jgi:hypothetical protein
MATPEGVEPPTLRSEVSILPLIPKQIKPRTRQIPAKSCKIRNPRATKNKHLISQNRQNDREEPRLQLSGPPSLVVRQRKQEEVNGEIRRGIVLFFLDGVSPT